MTELFLFVSSYETRAFRVYLEPYTLGSVSEPVYTTYPSGTQPTWIYLSIGWTINAKGGENTERYRAEDGPTPGTAANPKTWWEVENKTKKAQTCTYTLVPLSILDGDLVVPDGGRAGDEKGGKPNHLVVWPQ